MAASFLLSIFRMLVRCWWFGFVILCFVYSFKSQLTLDMFVDNSRYKDLIEWFGQGTSNNIDHHVVKCFSIVVAKNLIYVLRNDVKFLNRYCFLHLDIVECYSNSASVLIYSVAIICSSCLYSILKSGKPAPSFPIFFILVILVLTYLLFLIWPNLI